MILTQLCSVSKRWYAFLLGCIAYVSHASRLQANSKSLGKSHGERDRSITSPFAQSPSLLELNSTQAFEPTTSKTLALLLALQTSSGWQAVAPGSTYASSLSGVSSQRGVVAGDKRADSRSHVRMQDTQTPTINFPSPVDILTRLSSEEARELQSELLELAFKQDPKVVIERTLDLVKAVNTVGFETATDLSSNKEITPPRLLRRMCEQLGATFVKLGQFIASSPTLFPAEYVKEFQTVLDQTPPMPWSTVRPLIEEQLGKPLSSVYSSVEEKPLAAASIAQVHAATLRTGEDVVIKVQRKGVEGSLRADLDLLYANARVLQLVGVVTGEFSELVGTLRAAILEEIDFKLEANRTMQFSGFLDRSPELKGLVTVPKVYPDSSADRIITLERLYGAPLVDLDSVRKYTDSPETALIVALNTWVLSVLTNEWFHADLHAGNLLMLTDGRVAFIDFGIVGSIPRSTADAMLMFVQSFSAQDMQGIAKALSGMGFTKELDEAAAQAFARDLQEVLNSVESMPAPDPAATSVSPSDFDEDQLNRAVAAVGRVATNYGIRFPREFALLVKQVLYFDRYTSLLAPDLDVLNDERMAMAKAKAPMSVTLTSDGSGTGPQIADVELAKNVEVIDVDEE